MVFANILGRFISSNLLESALIIWLVQWYGLFCWCYISMGLELLDGVRNMVFSVIVDLDILKTSLLYSWNDHIPFFIWGDSNQLSFAPFCINILLLFCFIVNQRISHIINNTQEGYLRNIKAPRSIIRILSPWQQIQFDSFETINEKEL